MKKILLLLLITSTTAAYADNDIHTGELRGDYSKESHVDSVWRDTYVEDGRYVVFSSYYSRANYTRADFTNSNLTSVNFCYANLTDTNFTGANLTSADFYSASLKNADFTNATIRGGILETLSCSDLQKGN